MPGPAVDNVASFRAGDPLSAAKLQSLADAARQQRLQPGSFQSGAFSVQRLPQRGSNSTFNLTAFAVVVEDAGANGSGAGAAVLLDEFLEPLDEDGEPLILDENDPDYSPEKIDAVKLPFYSAHTDSACGKDARVRLFATRPIVPGSTGDPEHPVWGIHVDGSAYWEGHSSFANNRYLGGTGGNAEYRDFQTGTPSGEGSGSGACDGEGNMDVTIDLTVGGGPFVVKPT